MYRSFYCVPNLQSDCCLLVDRKDLGGVLDTDCHVVLVGELAFDVAVYEAGLPDA